MALPKRWEPYCPVGTRIEGTRFISFKVPLNKNLCNKLPEDKRFSPSQLVEVIEEQGQSLAMVIDLTNTNRYYNKQDIESHGIQYEKVYTEGHKVPRDGVVKRFYSAVDRILQETDGEDSLIGVHCTHGVNRTGYLICRYMVEKMSVDPEKAIAAFEEARGHPIERDNYLKDLKMRKNGGPGLKEDSPDESRASNGYNQRSYDQRFRPYSSDNYNGDRPGFKDDCAAGRMASSGYWDFRQNYRTDRYNSVEQYEGPQYWHDDYYCSDDYYLPQPAWCNRGRNSQHSRQFNSTGPPHSSRWHPYSLDRRNNRNQRDQSDR